MTLPGADLSRENWRDHAAPAVDPTHWTAIVPAAGKGARLGYHRPKILYPVAERTILEWLLDFLSPNCVRLVFVLSPEGHSEVAGELERLVPGRFDVVIQHEPTGMGDAVALGVAAAETPHVAIVWGDQVALRREAVDACLRLHDGPLAPAATIPTVLRDQPYIHFERDESGAICRLRQRREGDTMPARGESDTGFFCFQAAPLRALLERLREQSQERGAATGEFNFLPVIPLAARFGWRVITPRLMSLEETVGINSAEDARTIESFLRRTDVSS